MHRTCLKARIVGDVKCLVAGKQQVQSSCQVLQLVAGAAFTQKSGFCGRQRLCCPALERTRRKAVCQTSSEVGWLQGKLCMHSTLTH